MTDDMERFLTGDGELPRGEDGRVLAPPDAMRVSLQETISRLQASAKAHGEFLHKISQVKELMDKAKVGKNVELPDELLRRMLLEMSLNAWTLAEMVNETLMRVEELEVAVLNKQLDTLANTHIKED